MKVLFVCSRNKIRSLTAELLLRSVPGFQARSAGTAAGARVRVSAGHIGWADAILVMEARHRDHLRRRFRRDLVGKTLACLHVPDEYGLMEPALVELLWSRMAQHLPLPPRLNACDPPAEEDNPAPISRAEDDP